MISRQRQDSLYILCQFFTYFKDKCWYPWINFSIWSFAINQRSGINKYVINSSICLEYLSKNTYINISIVYANFYTHITKHFYSKIIFWLFFQRLWLLHSDLSKKWQEHIFHVFHGNEADACIIFQLAVPPFARPLWYIHQRQNCTFYVLLKHKVSNILTKGVWINLNAKISWVNLTMVFGLRLVVRITPHFYFLAVLP